MTDVDVAAIRDPVMMLVLSRGLRPQTIGEFLAAVDERNDEPDGLPDQVVYLASEAGQLPASAKISRPGRFVVIRKKKDDPNERDFLVSCGTHGNGFLQAIGWDEEAGVFNFYERLASTWSLAGNSDDAFDPRSRGVLGSPFDSHVNGTLVMKELEFPWLHWHSNVSTGPFSPAVLDGNVLGLGLDGITDAENLERRSVKPAVIRSIEVRLARLGRANSVDDAPALFRHLFVGTTINLVTSTTKSAEVTPTSDLDLPQAFFSANPLLTDLGLTVRPTLAARGSDYLAAIDQFGVALEANGFRQPGDTFFAFPVPARAFEDDEVVRQLVVGERWITRRFAATALLVDFPNPVFSARRASLMQFVPTQLRRHGEQGLATDVLAAILAEGARDQTSPAGDFAKIWNLGAAALQDEAQRRLRPYFDAIDERLVTRNGYRDLFRLAESRRRDFASLPLREFPLTLPVSNIPPDEPRRQMTDRGEVVPRP